MVTTNDATWEGEQDIGARGSGGVNDNLGFDDPAAAAPHSITAFPLPSSSLQVTSCFSDKSR